MTRVDRLNLAARTFCLAAVLGMSLSLLDTEAVRSTILLVAISAVAMAADVGSRVSRWYICGAESFVAALIIGLGLPDTLPLLPYLLVPSLIVGISVGLSAVLAVVGLESIVVLIVAVAVVGREGTGELASVVLPWLIAAAGVGALCAWLRESGSVLRGLPADRSYESARRLITQLRTVARRLSSGLDAVTISSQILAEVQTRFETRYVALFVRTESGLFAPLAVGGAAENHILAPSEAEMRALGKARQAIQLRKESTQADRRCRITLPLHSEDRLVGAVVCECASPQAQGLIDSLVRQLEALSLRLDTALAFEEIRELATMEERHRLAREIHDGIAQEISALGYAVDDLVSESPSEEQRQRLRALRAELSRVVNELRLSIFDLKSEVSAGLGSALSDYVRRVGAQSGLTVHLVLDQTPSRLRPEVETELLRIAQEAITNARKHSGAKNLWVTYRVRPPHAFLEVVDDGGGMGESTPRSDSYGIGIMRERATRIGATLDIDELGVRQSGTRVVVRLGPAPLMTGSREPREATA